MRVNQHIHNIPHTFQLQAIQILYTIPFKDNQIYKAIFKYNKAHPMDDYIYRDNYSMEEQVIQQLVQDLTKLILEDTTDTAPKPKPHVELPDLKQDQIFTGLQNSESTCYFNSILQAYFQQPDFVKDVLSFQRSTDFKKENF